MSLTERLRAVDDLQQRHPRLSFPAAVVKKFGDDQAGQLAALIAYYAFVSLFPLLLVFVTVLGFVLQGNPSAQESILNSTLSQFPIIGTQLQHNVHSLTGSAGALAIGLVGLATGGAGHHRRRAERLQPGLARAAQGPPQLPLLAPARPRHDRRARAPEHSLPVVTGAVTAQIPKGTLATVGGVLLALGGQPAAVLRRLPPAHRR